MRVVVTGATGNVGTSLVEALVADPDVEAVVAVARRRPEWAPAKTQWVEADIRADDLRAVFDGADAVVHLAWAFQPTHDPVATWENNVRGSLRVFDAAAAAKVGALVHASSVGTYRARVHHAPVDESWPTDALPTAAYGREKAYLEQALNAVENDNPQMRVVRMRPCFLFKSSAASSQRRIFGGPFVPTSALRLPIPILPVPTGLRFQALHTDDVAEAYRLALHRSVRGPFNLAAEPVIDGHRLARLLGGRPVDVPPAAVRGFLATAWHLRVIPASPFLFDLFLGLPLLDSGRASTELGWRPLRSGEQALEELFEGLRHRRSFPTPPLRADRPGRLDELTPRSIERRT